jgi:replicative DNA helicase
MTPPISDSLTKYGSSFQTKIVTSLLIKEEFIQTIYDLIQPEQLDTESKQWLVREIKAYFYEYKVLPTLDSLKVKINEITNEILKESIIDELREVMKYVEATDLDFIQNETIQFCKNQALKSAIVQSVDLLQRGEYDNIKRIIDNAMRAGTRRDIGLEYVKDFDTIMDQVARETVSTGFMAIDDILDGGLAAGELGIVVAPSGIGKSWVLQALGANALRAGMNVMHYTLELNQAYVGLRYGAIFSKIETSMIPDKRDKVKKMIEDQCKGELLIKYYPSKAATVQTIYTHLKTVELMGHSPDLILLDYADLLSDTSGFGELRHQLGNIYEELRGLSGEFGIPVWTASQSNRSSLEESIIGAEKIAESYNKIMTADFVMSLSRKIEDKVANTGRIHIIKNRFGPDGLTFPTTMNTAIGQIEVYEAGTSSGITVQNKMNNGNEYVRKLLKKRYDDFESQDAD